MRTRAVQFGSQGVTAPRVFRLRKTNQAAEQPAAKKPKTQQAACLTELSIKVCSMDGSSLTVDVARDADIGDTKTAIKTANPALSGTIIRLHAVGVEDPLTDAERVSSVFVDDDDSKDPVLFMFHLTHGFEMVKELDAKMAALHQRHAATIKEDEAVYVGNANARNLAFTEQLNSQASLIKGCFEAMRHDSDGESCQICGTNSPTALQDCAGRCGLQVCSTCRPQKVMCAAGANGPGDCNNGGCCAACWKIKFHDDFGVCQCGGCINRALPEARCNCFDGAEIIDGQFGPQFGPPGESWSCSGQCDGCLRGNQGTTCREDYCQPCADNEELAPHPPAGDYGY